MITLLQQLHIKREYLTVFKCVCFQDVSTYPSSLLFYLTRYFNDPNAAAAFQVDPNQTTTETANNDPYSEYAQYYAEPASPTQYHYA